MALNDASTDIQNALLQAVINRIFSYHVGNVISFVSGSYKLDSLNLTMADCELLRNKCYRQPHSHWIAARPTMLGNRNWVARIQNLESTLDLCTAKHVLLKCCREMPARSSDVATMGLCEFAVFGPHSERPGGDCGYVVRGPVVIPYKESDGKTRFL